MSLGRKRCYRLAQRLPTEWRLYVLSALWTRHTHLYRYVVDDLSPAILTDQWRMLRWRHPLLFFFYMIPVITHSHIGKKKLLRKRDEILLALLLVCFSATHCRFSSESVSYFFSSVRRSALSFHLLCKWITRWRHRNGWMRISVRRERNVGTSNRPIWSPTTGRERERLFSWKISRVLQFSFLATQSAFFLSTPTRQNGKREKSCSSCWTPRPLFRVARSGHGTCSLLL